MPNDYDEMAGYLIVPHDEVPDRYNGGFSMFISAWPLLNKYPGNYFQTGLFGTWMFAQQDEPSKGKHYSDVEGGLGWWRDTRFGTRTPKFIMGGVAKDFCAWANGPGAGKGRDWDAPNGKYGVVQLSSRVLWPPDGLNLKQGTCGELFGYGYLPMPLTPKKATTNGCDVPTGENCWTLFLSTENFKGPVAFFSPNFFSESTVGHPDLAGKFLDSRPSAPNRAIQMETQHVPAKVVEDSDGNLYARVAITQFPIVAGTDESLVIKSAACYTQNALMDPVRTWLKEGGDAPGFPFSTDETCLYNFPGKGRSTWKIYTSDTTREERKPIEWEFVTPFSPDGSSYGFKWDLSKVERVDTEDGPMVVIPEYFALRRCGDQDMQWVPIDGDEIPDALGLREIEFEPQWHGAEPEERVAPEDRNLGAYVTPDDPDSCWKTPGPASGPHYANPADGSTVTYYWYRFADQPAMMQAGLSDDEREQVQAYVEMMHNEWSIDQDYLAVPTSDALAELDPALIVTPPAGLESGYVPIATRQSADD